MVNSVAHVDTERAGDCFPTLVTRTDELFKVVASLNSSGKKRLKIHTNLINCEHICLK